MEGRQATSLEEAGVHWGDSRAIGTVVDQACRQRARDAHIGSVVVLRCLGNDGRVVDLVSILVLEALTAATCAYSRTNLAQLSFPKLEGVLFVHQAQ